jgi:2-dehydro-3-deoxyphosphogalactonate aldolase
LQAGAHALKMFPADSIGLSAIKAWRAVLPSEIQIFCVGGVSEHNLAAYYGAGADGVAVGTSLYTPGTSTASLHRKARALTESWGQLRQTA